MKLLTDRSNEEAEPFRPTIRRTYPFQIKLNQITLDNPIHWESYSRHIPRPWAITLFCCIHTHWSFESTRRIGVGLPTQSKLSTTKSRADRADAICQLTAVWRQSWV